MEKNITTILDHMQELFGDYPATELHYETPFQLLLAVMMSAQTTDVQVNKVTKTLFKKIKNPADVLEMGEKKFGQAISSIGLWRGKAKNIFATAGMILEMSKLHSAESYSSFWAERSGVEESRNIWDKGDCHIANAPGNDDALQEVYQDVFGVYKHHGYVIPDTIEEMVKLPGVWIKTAKVVLYVLYRQRRVAVDTHVHRVINRLWIVSTKYPEKTSEQLEKIIPDEYKDIAHHVIIYFGRYLCKAKNPECERCPLRIICEWYDENVNV